MLKTAQNLERWVAAVVLVLAAYLVFANLGARSLENKDITRTTELARETLETGRWLALTREGEIETEKPPLYVWLVALVGKVTGRVGPLESRLPSAIASYLAVLLVFAWLARKHGVAEATLGAAFLAAGQVFVELARFSRVDALFAFLLAASALLAHEAERGARGRRLALAALSGVALAGAMLTKSPLLAVVLHLASIGGFYIVDLARERPWEKLREPAALTIARRFVAPAASVPPILACALFACWLIPFKSSITPAEWDAVWNQFRFENTERAVTGSDKPHSFWFYVPVVLVRAAPSSLFAFILARHEDPEVRWTHRFAQCWWVFPFLVLSIATGKNARYVLPCLPGLAVAAALNWRALATSEDGWAVAIDRGVAWIALVATATGAVVVPVGVAVLAPEVLGDACWIATLGAATAVLAWRATRGRGGVWPLLLALFAIHAMWNVVLLPSAPFERPRAVVRHLARALPDDVKLGELVYYVPPAQLAKGESRQRRTRTLLSIYRDETELPLLALSPEQLFRELSVSDRRRALLDGPAWDSLAPVASSLVVDRVLSVALERGEERYRLVRRAR